MPPDGIPCGDVQLPRGQLFQVHRTTVHRTLWGAVRRRQGDPCARAPTSVSPESSVLPLCSRCDRPGEESLGAVLCTGRPPWPCPVMVAHQPGIRYSKGVVGAFIASAQCFSTTNVIRLAPVLDSSAQKKLKCQLSCGGSRRRLGLHSRQGAATVGAVEVEVGSYRFVRCAFACLVFCR